MARAVSDPVMPHSIEAEQAVLGAVLVNPDTWPKAAALLHVDDFYRTAHAQMFKAMCELSEVGTAIDIVTLSDKLGKQGLEDVGGVVYFVQITDGVPRSTNIEHYAEIVREKARLRRLISASTRLSEDAYAEEGPAVGLIQQMMRSLSDVVRASSSGYVTAQSAVHSYVETLYRGESVLIPTGFSDLDAVIGGFKRGDFVIVAARPSVGKSSFGLGLARNAAYRSLPSIDFSIEMGLESLAARLIGWDSGVSSNRLERQLATQEEYQRAGDVVSSLNYPLYLETSATSVSEIAAWSKLANKNSELAFIVIDYMQMLTGERQRGSASDEMAGISRSLKLLAKETNSVVIGLSQLNRAPETRKDKRPHVSDLRGSGAFEQDCDVALLLFREEMHAPTPENAGIAEIIVAKNRNGPTGVVRLAWVNELAMFDNLQRED